MTTTTETTAPRIPRPKFKSKLFAGTETAPEEMAPKAKAPKGKKAAKLPKAEPDKKADIAEPAAAAVAPKKQAKKAKAKADKKADKAAKPDKKAAKAAKPTKFELASARADNIPAPTVTLSGNMAPGVEVATELDKAFAYLNDKLFDNKVEPCVVVVSKLKRANGFFWHSQFARRADLKNRVHEIGIDFRRIAESGKGDLEVLSTIAHEMAHALVYQLDKADAMRTGKEFRPKTYHCATWAAIMNRVGLKPVAIGPMGLPTGKETGPNATHDITKGGAFEKVAKALLADGFRFSWTMVGGFYDDNGKAVSVTVGKGGKMSPVEGDGEAKPRKARAGAKAVHICPHCQSKAWSKPSLVVTCTGTKTERHEPTEMDCDRSAYEGGEASEASEASSGSDD